MAVYLVMRNSLYRRLHMKSTYLLLIAIPLAIIVSLFIMDRLGNSKVKVGILGTQEQYEVVASDLEKIEGVPYEHANMRSIHTDIIMGKYDVVLDGSKGVGQKELQEIAAAGESQRGQAVSPLKRMIGMIAMIYMIIASIYASRVIDDKGKGVLTRVAYAGKRRVGYYAGYWLSTMCLLMVQVMISILTLIIWNGGGISFVQFLALSLLISSMASVIGVGLTILCKSELSVNISASVIAVLCAVLGGSFIAVEQMPGILMMLGHCSPIYWLCCLI